MQRGEGVIFERASGREKINVWSLPLGNAPRRVRIKCHIPEIAADRELQRERQGQNCQCSEGGNPNGRRPQELQKAVSEVSQCRS